jgi:NAD(P)-dependent dehydrogenase (short-subunit alcohol dehydrogenase family)
MLFAADLLAGRRILVTGASSGLGRATAVLLAQCGAQLVLTGRDAGRLDATLSQLAGSGHAALPFDLTGDDDTSDFLKIATGGERPLAGIFHAAGVDMIRPVKLAKAKQFDEVFGAAVRGAAALARGAALPGVMADGGAIALMSSVAAHSGQAGMGLYSGAKAALEGMARSLAVEFAPRRIRVNCIAAAAVRTEMHERLAAAMPDEALRSYEERHLLGFGEALDVAQAAAFLLSDGGRWVTGATWTLDGGYLAR